MALPEPLWENPFRANLAQLHSLLESLSGSTCAGTDWIESLLPALTCSWWCTLVLAVSAPWLWHSWQVPHICATVPRPVATAQGHQGCWKSCSCISSVPWLCVLCVWCQCHGTAPVGFPELKDRGQQHCDPSSTVTPAQLCTLKISCSFLSLNKQSKSDEVVLLKIHILIMISVIIIK